MCFGVGEVWVVAGQVSRVLGGAPKGRTPRSGRLVSSQFVGALRRNCVSIFASWETWSGPFCGCELYGAPERAISLLIRSPKKASQLESASYSRPQGQGLPPFHPPSDPPSHEPPRTTLRPTHFPRSHEPPEIHSDPTIRRESPGPETIINRLFRPPTGMTIRTTTFGSGGYQTRWWTRRPD